jgi:hypothetical protein
MPARPEGETMQHAMSARTPAHLWIVGILSLLWSLFGAYDYTMTRTRNMDYIASAMPGVDPNAALSWIDGMPFYAQIGWGLGVWMALLGSVLLLIRSRWSVWAFGLSLLGALISLGYQLVLAPVLPGASGLMYTIMPLIIIAVALFQFLYTRAMEQKDVLR